MHFKCDSVITGPGGKAPGFSGVCIAEEDVARPACIMVQVAPVVRRTRYFKAEAVMRVAARDNGRSFGILPERGRVQLFVVHYIVLTQEVAGRCVDGAGTDDTIEVAHIIIVGQAVG